MPIVRRRLKEARQDAGLSQEEVAKKLGLGSHAAYGHYERGEADPDLTNFVKLSKILGKPVTWLLGIEDGHDLSPDEKELLETYRGLSRTSKEYVLGIAQDFLKREQSTKE